MEIIKTIKILEKSIGIRSSFRVVGCSAPFSLFLYQLLNVSLVAIAQKLLCIFKLTQISKHFESLAQGKVTITTTNLN